RGRARGASEAVLWATSTVYSKIARVPVVAGQAVAASGPEHWWACPPVPPARSGHRRSGLPPLARGQPPGQPPGAPFRCAGRGLSGAGGAAHAAIRGLRAEGPGGAQGDREGPHRGDRLQRRVENLVLTPSARRHLFSAPEPAGPLLILQVRLATPLP